MSLLALLGLAACDTKGDGVSAPVHITSQAPDTASVHEPFAYQVEVDDAEGTATYSLLTGPLGMGIDAAGLVTWTPSIEDLGSVSVSIEVADSRGSATQEFSLEVDQGLYLGLGISPRGHTDSSTSDDFIAQYALASELGKVIGFFDPWRIDGSPDGELTDLTEAAFVDAENFDFIPLVTLKWSNGLGESDLTSDSDPGNNSWSNAETRAEFLSVVEEIARNWQPRYLGLGHETNLYWATHSADEWTDWISVFEECYDLVKSISPETMVFTIFQWEIMKNLGVDTIGWDAGEHFALIDDHAASGKIDAIAFTSFPYFEYAAPADMPATYYDEIGEHWDGPVLFTEIAWPAAAHPPFPGGEADQSEFIGRFFDLTADFDLEQVSWTYLHDWDGESGAPAFASIGLRSNDGSTIRAAESEWASEIVLRQRP